jgi:hypothetical protein
LLVERASASLRLHVGPADSEVRRMLDQARIVRQRLLRFKALTGLLAERIARVQTIAKIVQLSKRYSGGEARDECRSTAG